MKFNLSINISQGVSDNFNYIVTPNAQKVYGNIVDSFQSGIHSFLIIGTYGTGKSSFLMALEQDLLNNKSKLVSERSVFADAKRLADGRGGQFVVPGDHNRPDTGSPAPCDGERRLFSRRIHKGGKADKDQVIVAVFMYGRRSRFGQITISNGKHTERISGIHLQDVTEVLFLQGTKRFFSFFCQYFCTTR